MTDKTPNKPLETPLKVDLDKVIVEPELEPKVETRGRKKGSKYKKKLNLEDVELPIAILLINLSQSIATARNDTRWTMTQIEAEQIQDGLKNWIEYRLPMLEKFYPEICLFVPISIYLLRVANSPKITTEIIPPK